MGIVGHESVGMFMQSNEERLRLNLEFMWNVIYPFFLFVIRSYIFMYDIGPYIVYLAPNPSLLLLILPYVVSWSVPASILGCLSSSVFFGGILRLMPEFNPSANRLFCLL